MTQLTHLTYAVASTQHRRNLARSTGAAGLFTLVVVLGSSLANDYQSAATDSNADETVASFRSLDDAFGAFSSFATAVGLIAMLWFTLGLALLLRRYDGELPWRSVFLAGAGVVSVVAGQIATWEAAGAVGICTGLIVLGARELPHWLGWWALVAGVGSVLARAVWTEDHAYVPFTAFWIWVAVLSVVLLAGRFAVAGAKK